LGAIEIPPTGGLIALLRGRPVTAGYPVAAVATASTIDRLGQVRPGDRVMLRRCAQAAAASALAEMQRNLVDLARRAARVYRTVGLGCVVHPNHLSHERT
jgi:allophanate hydrolase subunit 2